MEGMSLEQNPTQEIPLQYRTSSEVVNALSNQFQIDEEKFFNVHSSADRNSRNKDIQDPKTWVEALTLTPDAKVVNANLEASSMYLNFSTKGEFPRNLSPDSKTGKFIETIIGEAKLLAVQKAMPDTYATGKKRVSEAIEEIRKLRGAVIKGPDRSVSLNKLLTVNESGKVNIGFGVAMTAVTASLILTACGPGVIIPPMPVTPDGGGTGPRITETSVSPTATEAPTATATNTPEPTATATKEIKQFPVCSVENYRDCEIQYQDLFNGNYLNWLNTLSKPFDESQVNKDVKVVDFPGTMITYGGSLGDPNKDPVRRGVTVGYVLINDGEVGYKEWYGKREYAVLPIEFDVNGESVWRIFVMPKANNESDTTFINKVKQWLSGKSFGIITNEYYTGLQSNGNTKDPLTTVSFDEDPNLPGELHSFAKSKDPNDIPPETVLETIILR